LIRAYCRENDLAERPKPGAEKKRARAGSGDDQDGPGERTLMIGQSYQAGGSVAALVELWNVQPRTILTHLAKFVQAGFTIPAGDILEQSALPAEEQARVLAAFEEHGPAYLRPVFEALDGAVSYDELHILRLYFLASQDKGKEPTQV
jgi:ATP-dependent DNA helicase RecQ